MNPELENIDSDLKEYFLENEGEYVPGIPVKIQIVRLLRRLLDKRNDREYSSGDGEGSKDNVEPQQLEGKPAGSAFVFIDGIRKLLADSSEQSALDLLVSFRSGLRVIAQGLDEFRNRNLGVLRNGSSHGAKVQCSQHDLAERTR